jgi:hypothetical protein
MKKIRELGSLPADAFDKYKSTNVKAVGILVVYFFPTFQLRISLFFF